MADNVLSWLAQQPGDDVLSPVLKECSDLINQKLWHQFTLKIEDVVNSGYFKKSSPAIPLHTLFSQLVFPLGKHLAPYTITQLLIAASETLPTPQESLDYITQNESCIDKNHLDSSLLIDIIKAYWTVLSNNPFDALDILTKVQKIVDNSTQVFNNYTKALLHKTSAIISEQRGKTSLAYNEYLIYLAYADLKTIDVEECKELVVNIALLALCSENILNLNEFMLHDIVQYLPESQNVYQLIQLYQHNNIDEFDHYLDSHKDKLHTKIINNIPLLKRKIRIAVLVNTIFARNSNERTLSFSEIAKICHIPESQVEDIILYALGIDVIRGTIDGIRKYVNITWIQSQYLSSQQLLQLSNVFEHSIVQSNNTLTFITDIIQQQIQIQSASLSSSE